MRACVRGHVGLCHSTLADFGIENVKSKPATAPGLTEFIAKFLKDFASPQRRHKLLLGRLSSEHLPNQALSFGSRN